MFFHAFWLMVQELIGSLASFIDVFSCNSIDWWSNGPSFLDVLSCNSIDGSVVYWHIGFILWCSFMWLDWSSNGPFNYWLNFLMFFHAFWLMVQELIGSLASFFDVLSCKLIDGSVVHWCIGFILWCSLMYFDWSSNGPLTYWFHSLMFFQVFLTVFCILICNSWMFLQGNQVIADAARHKFWGHLWYSN